MVRSFNRPSTAISSKTCLRVRNPLRHHGSSGGDYVSARYIGPIYLTAIMDAGSNPEVAEPRARAGVPGVRSGPGIHSPLRWRSGLDRHVGSLGQGLTLGSFVTMFQPCEGSLTTRSPNGRSLTSSA